MTDRAGIREMISRHALASTVAAALVVVVAAGWIGYHLPESPPARPRMPTDAFFTADDGKTWFRGPINQAAPFEHDGKQAVKAHVFRCGGEEFVGYLEQFTPEAMKRIEEMEVRQAAIATRPAVPGEIRPAAMAARVRGETMSMLSLSGREVKRPGDAEWTRTRDAQAAGPIQQPRCPHGDPSHVPEFVVP